LYRTGLKLISTKGKGPDFCIQLDDGPKIWIEAVLSRPDQEMRRQYKEQLATDINKLQAHSVPRDETALRYCGNLAAKRDKITSKYADIIKSDDYVIIAISGYPPANGMWADRDLFETAIFPISYQQVHISTDGKPLNPNLTLPTHQYRDQLTKKSGNTVNTGFLVPGNDNGRIDGILFSEAFNLQHLLGVTYWAGGPTDTYLDPARIYQNYEGKKLPEELTKYLHYHPCSDNPPYVTWETVAPTIKLGG
jgi:hypothetical protein